MASQKRFLKIKEAMLILDVSKRSIWNYISQGKLTPYRGPSGRGSLRLLREEVENFFRPTPETD